ncbi:MAG: hypothetical protein D6720_08545 [Gammaproteobacteria bacterium]|nr:MAG: hypothetical protein D6720_08545 [Gammaproteobacteria bacterium]
MTEERKRRAMENKTQPDTRNIEKSGTPDEKRRRLTQAAIATPILGALASRPALGQGRQCSASVLMSGNASNIGIDYTTCTLCNPGFWLIPGGGAAHQSCWATAGINATDTVRTVFTNVSQNYTCLPSDGSCTLSDVTGGNNDEKSANIVREVMARWEVGQLDVTTFATEVANELNAVGLAPPTPDYAEPLFLFFQAAITALLNARVTPIKYPDLAPYFDGATYPSETSIRSDVAGVMNNLDKSFIEGKTSDLEGSWAGSSTSECLLSGQCS